jgi:hypothetical protein
VTCGEHIAIEPVLFEQFFEGTRVAPRHIMVELEGGEQYDIYYAFDTQSVFATVVEGISTRAPVEPEINRGDRSLLERVASREIHDRAEVEAAYRAGDRVLRRRILESAASFREIPQTDLLRLALFGDDPELRRTALNVLLASPTPASIQLIGAVLDLPLDEVDRAGLIAILVKLSESSAEARTLAAVHRGLGGASTAVDTDRWASALEYAAAHTGARDAAARLEEGEASAAVDPTALLTMAEGYLALAAHPGADADYSKLLFADAREAAIAAGDAGADGWRPAAVLALSNYYLGQREEAYALAEDAVGGLPEDADSWSAAAALGLFAEVRQRDIANAANTKQPWPPEWLADLNGAYDVLADHPFGTDLHASNQYEFLRALKAQREAERILERGLKRFPDSQALHAHLRSQILFRSGIQGLDGLEGVYARMLSEEGASPNLPWFAGYASLVTAEFLRRSGDDPLEAADAYRRAVAHFEQSIENSASNGISAQHYIALCLGGRARIAYEIEDDARAVVLIVDSFAHSPDSASSLDGLNLSTVDTAKMVRARLTERGERELLSKLQVALDALDPKHLELPAYEGRGPTGRMRRGPMGRRRRSGN